jgi:hypothetical protein
MVSINPLSLHFLADRPPSVRVRYMATTFKLEFLLNLRRYITGDLSFDMFRSLINRLAPGWGHSFGSSGSPVDDLFGSFGSPGDDLFGSFG